MTNSSFEQAVRMVLTLCQPGPVGEAEVERNCDDVISLFVTRGDPPIDRVALIREIQAKVVIWQDGATGLEDSTGHEAWLPEKRKEIDWRFWERYRLYLESEEMLPPQVVNRIDESTDRVLSKLEDPERLGAWDRRGLVVGQVQSGKTAHYTGLVCKAADAGYRLVIVLAGLHNSLRSQTQLRLDEGFLGIDTQHQQRSDDGATQTIGAGAMLGAKKIPVGSLTTSHEAGDFKKQVAKNMNLPIVDMPVLLVVKKHTTILKNLINWITSGHGEPVGPDGDERIVRGLPMLVIDDEADNASMNTKDPETDPTATNMQIRTLLKSFEKSAYVGYTATPFANIFAWAGSHNAYGLDLFPRSFIESLKPPTNYLGPARVFGFSGVDSDEGVEPLNIFRSVNDYGAWMPDKHKKDWDPRNEELPKSLCRSIHSFVLASAARRARGQVTKHQSMLVHVTRFQEVQRKVYEQIAEYVETLKRRVRYGDGDSLSVWEELEELWVNDFEPTSDGWETETVATSWLEVREQIGIALEKIEIRIINGSSRDALEYYENRNTGLSVIAIGGDKLSRGLTLEGLSTSYYLRASKMYDTLMQMGRWFGYRPGYEDLCRLYTTPTLFDWYREITAASEELRTEFDEMAMKGVTPEQYGLKVRMSPAGLSISSPNKLRNAGTVTLSFSGDGPETTTWDITEGAVEANRLNLEQFVEELSREIGAPQTGTGVPGFVWEEVPGMVVARSFFGGYQGANTALRTKPEFISTYIRESISRFEELTSWTVAVLSNQKADAETVDLAGLSLGLFSRSNLNKIEEIKDTNHYTIRRLLSPKHESLDLSQEQVDAALLATQTRYDKEKAQGLARGKTRPTSPAGPEIRAQRDSRRALLLIYVVKKELDCVPDHLVGYVASFPVSPNAVAANYKVGDIWQQLALAGFDGDEND